MNAKRQLQERLWEAMLVVFPAIVVQDLKMAVWVRSARKGTRGGAAR